MPPLAAAEPADEGLAGGINRPFPEGVVPKFMVPWLPTDGVALNKYPGGVVPKVLLTGVEGPLNWLAGDEDNCWGPAA